MNKQVTIDMYMLNKGYNKYIDIEDLLLKYEDYLQLPETDPDDADNEYYDPESHGENVFYLSCVIDKLKHYGPKLANEKVDVNGVKFTIKYLDNVQAKVGDTYYYSSSVLNHYIKNDPDIYENYFVGD